MRAIIRSGRVIDPKSGFDEICDVLVEGGRILDIGRDIDCECDLAIDASGLCVAPGLVDMHCHLRQPGFEYKEDIASGTKSACAGGFTSVACMPNLKPVADNYDVVRGIHEAAREKALANVYVIGAITAGQRGEALADYGAMARAGIAAISDDGRPVADKALLERAMEAAHGMGIALISHSEDLALTGDGVMNLGSVSERLGLPGIPAAAEEEAIRAEVGIAEKTGYPIHIAHVSTRGSVALIRAAKARGVPVTCETCPHYFALTDRAVEERGAMAKMSPPLRSAADAAAVIEGLADGTLDAIATDHAPHAAAEKSGGLLKAANGIIGFETALALSLEKLYKSGAMGLSDMLAKLTYIPAGILGIGAGRLSAGGRADITIFDPNERWTYREKDIFSKAKNTPFLDKELIGRVKYTMVNGRLVFKNGLLAN